MLKEDADYDMRDIRRRIAKQAGWIEQLKCAGQSTGFAQQELAELMMALDHIEHHRAVLEFSLGGPSSNAREMGVQHGR
jgi:hypothetical protein